MTSPDSERCPPTDDGRCKGRPVRQDCQAHHAVTAVTRGRAQPPQRSGSCILDGAVRSSAAGTRVGSGDTHSNSLQDKRAQRQGPGTRTITEPGGPTGLAVGPGLQPAGHKGGRRQQGWGGGRGDAQNKRASARTSTTEHNGPVDPPGLESATRRLQRAITTKWSEGAISGKWRVQRCPDRQWVM